MIYQTFTVRGRGPFPSAMLLEDKCWPADIESAESILYADRSIIRPIKLKRHVEVGSTEKPDVTAWRQMGWTVDDVKTGRR
jgi:hypothetical protein